MGFRTLLLAATVLLSGTAVARAASGSFGIHGGLSAPSGDLARAVGDGFHFGLSLEHVVDSRNSVGLDANYHVLAEKTTAPLGAGFPLTLREKATILEAALCFRVVVAPKGTPVVPHVKLGFGIDHMTADLTISSPSAWIWTSDSNSWFGMLGGAGVTIPLSDATGVYFDGLFHPIESDNEPASLFTVSIGLKSSGKR